MKDKMSRRIKRNENIVKSGGKNEEKSNTATATGPGNELFSRGPCQWDAGEDAIKLQLSCNNCHRIKEVTFQVLLDEM